MSKVPGIRGFVGRAAMVLAVVSFASCSRGAAPRASTIEGDFRRLYRNIHYGFNGIPVGIDFTFSQRVSDDHLAGLARYPTLEEVDLSYTNIKGTGLPHLKDLPRLRTLVLDATDIDDKGMMNIEGLQQLKTLVLEGNTKMTAEAMKSVAKLANLEVLVLRATNVGDKGLAYLRGHKKLQFVDLEGAGITDAGLTYLKDLAALQDVSISPGRGVTKEGLEKIRRALPRVTVKPRMASSDHLEDEPASGGK